jgi:hypothetical protein
MPSSSPASTYDGTPIEFSPSKLTSARSSFTPSLALSLKDSIGHPTQEHQRYAQQLLASIPPTLLDTAHSHEHANIIIYILILATMSSQGKKAIEIIKQHTDPWRCSYLIGSYHVRYLHTNINHSTGQEP